MIVIQINLYNLIRKTQNKTMWVSVYPAEKKKG